MRHVLASQLNFRLRFERGTASSFVHDFKILQTVNPSMVRQMPLNRARFMISPARLLLAYFAPNVTIAAISREMLLLLRHLHALASPAMDAAMDAVMDAAMVAVMGAYDWVAQFSKPKMSVYTAMQNAGRHELSRRQSDSWCACFN